GGIAARRVLVVGLGKRDQVDRAVLVNAAAAAARRITGKALDRVAIVLLDDLPGLSAERIAQAIGVGLMQGSQGPGLRKNKLERFVPRQFRLIAPATAPRDEIERGAQQAEVVG